MYQIRRWLADRRGKSGGSNNLSWRFSLAILAVGSAVVLTILVSLPARSAISTQTVTACGANIDIRFDNDSKGVSNDALLAGSSAPRLRYAPTMASSPSPNSGFRSPCAAAKASIMESPIPLTMGD